VRDVIFDSIADGVFTVDEDWNITSFNRAADSVGRNAIPPVKPAGGMAFRPTENVPAPCSRAVTSDSELLASGDCINAITARLANRTFAMHPLTEL
jgi:hypothetical protein